MKFLNQIRNAFVWEGMANHSIEYITDTHLVVSVTGWSTCEHSGDEDGIRDQVNDLIKEEYEEDGKVYTVMAASVDIRTEDRPGEDCDYSVTAKGKVTLYVKKKE